MKCHEVYALIYQGIVKNIIVGDYFTCEDIAKTTINEAAYAVDITYIPAAVGDEYKDGVFYRKLTDSKGNINTIEIKAKETENDMLSRLAADVETLQAAVIEIYEELGGAS